MSRSVLGRVVPVQAHTCVRAWQRPRCFYTPPPPSPRPRQSVLGILEERGLVKQIAGDGDVLDRLLSSRKVGVYAGIDPSASSLHLGHLLPLMVLFWMHRYGHYVVSLVGGATAKVGDPSGRLTSRPATAASLIDDNFRALYSQIGRLWTNVLRYGERHGQDPSVRGRQELLNNAQWLEQLNVLDFLRMMGHGVRLGTMLGRDTVKNKLSNGDGMSYAEFTYPLLQAWDWWHMYTHKSVQVQVGGGDQYGNIVAGVDTVKFMAQQAMGDNRSSLCRDANGRLPEQRTPIGLTVPLLTTSSGEKIGKSAGNAVWLDRNMTSPFDLYGFLLRTGDDDVERYLKLFTFVPHSEVVTTMAEHSRNPSERVAQHLLASEVLELVHGRREAMETRSEHHALRSPSVTSLSRFIIAEREGVDGADVPQRSKLPQSLVYNVPWARVLYHAGLVKTKSEGARTISSGGAYIASTSAPLSSDQDSQFGFVQIKDQNAVDVVIDNLLILRLGKWKVRVIEVVQDGDFEEAGGEAPGWKEFKAAATASSKNDD